MKSSVFYLLYYIICILYVIPVIPQDTVSNTKLILKDSLNFSKIGKSLFLSVSLNLSTASYDFRLKNNLVICILLSGYEIYEDCRILGRTHVQYKITLGSSYQEKDSPLHMNLYLFLLQKGISNYDKNLALDSHYLIYNVSSPSVSYNEFNIPSFQLHKIGLCFATHLIENEFDFLLNLVDRIHIIYVNISNTISYCDHHIHTYVYKCCDIHNASQCIPLVADCGIIITNNDHLHYHNIPDSNYMPLQDIFDVFNLLIRKYILLISNQPNNLQSMMDILPYSLKSITNLMYNNFSYSNGTLICYEVRCIQIFIVSLNIHMIYLCCVFCVVYCVFF